jgi:hypothetical protein
VLRRLEVSGEPQDTELGRALIDLVEDKADPAIVFGLLAEREHE